MPLRLAVIDIGSNAIRLLIAEVGSGGHLKTIGRARVTPRLGHGLERTGLLDAAALQPALAAIVRMAARARARGVASIDVVATSAVRDARNGRAFARQVRAVTGLPVRVLSGKGEALLAFKSAAAHFDLSSGRTVVCDIGGGSVEVALVSSGRARSLASLPLGAIRVTEEFLSADPPARQLGNLRSQLRERLLREIPALPEWQGSRLLGSGGTFTNLATVYQASRHASRRRPVHGTRIPRSEVEHILGLLAGTPVPARRSIPGLDPKRADIIVGGVAVAAELLALLRGPEIVVSAYGIREGILLERARSR